jgi:hypothetical protein
MPSQEFLVAFLEACEVTGEKAQRPWLVARARIITQDTLGNRTATPEGLLVPLTANGWAGAHVDGGAEAAEPRNGDPEPTTSEARGSARRPRLARWLVVGTSLSVLAVLLASVLMWRKMEDSDTTVTCVSQGCIAMGKELAVRGRLTGELPSGREVQLLIRVESMR